MLTVLLVVIVFLASGVLTWGVYELIRVASTGRVRLSTFISLMGVGLVFLVVVGPGVGLDAFACSDQAEIVIEAVPGPASGGLGKVEGRDFFNCTVYWYDLPRMWG